MSSRRSIVPIDDNNRIENSHNVHHEREDEKLRNERYDHRSGRQNLGDEQEKHNQGEQDRYTQCHLFTFIGGQVEDEYAEKANEHSGYDQVDRVEEGLAADAKVVDELHAIRLLRVGLFAGRVYDVPCTTRQVVLKVYHGFFSL